MDRNERIENVDIKGYEQVRTPDFARIANLVIKAKGNERSMSQFAEDTEIGASTLSRIINLNIKKPLSIDNINKIFEAREDKQDVTLLDSLLRANGFLPNEQAKRIKSMSEVSARHNDTINRARLIKNSLIASVVTSDLKVNEVYNTPLSVKDLTKTIPLLPSSDFVINVNKKSDSSEIFLWGFFIKLTSFNKEDTSYHSSISLFLKNLMYSACKIFLADAWEPDKLKDVKISFVIDDEEVFCKLNDFTKEAKLNNEMSIILVDKHTFQIVDEKWIPGNYERLCKTSIFTATIQDQDENEDFLNNQKFDDGFF